MKKKIAITFELLDNEYYQRATDKALEINLATAVKDAVVTTYATSYNKVDINEIKISDNE